MDKLEQIIYTLEKVEVHGADNMSRLLGCIQILQQMVAEQSIEVKGDDTDE